MLQGMYQIWSEYQRDEVAKWAKEQILQKNNCTRMQSSDSRLRKKLFKLVNRVRSHILSHIHSHCKHEKIR